MNNLYLKLVVKQQELKGMFLDLMNREEGQDLVEYALVVALIALGAIIAMKSLGTGINTAFNDISTTLASDL
jgi:pilus assembly protein Flp/PilA